MKKLVLALTTASLFALTACGGDKEKVEVNETVAPAPEVAAPPAIEPADAVPAQLETPAVEAIQEEVAPEPAPATKQVKKAKTTKKSKK